MVNTVQKLALVLAVIIGFAVPGFADAISDRVIALLRAQGFEVIQMDRTWLGRIWILAESKDVRREIVFNPATGEILRDYAVLRTAPPRDSIDDSSDPQVAAGNGTQTGAQSVGASGVVAAADPDALPPPGAKEWLSPSAGGGGNATVEDFMLDPVNPIAPQWGDDVVN